LDDDKHHVVMMRLSGRAGDGDEGRTGF
jgi:hypothetical protein